MLLCAALSGRPGLEVAALDFYRELGLRRGASQQDIKAAYRDLAKKYHPDKNKDKNAPQRFQRIASAYETLSDPDKRRSYDLHGEDYANVQQQQQQQAHFRQQQQDFFEAFGGRGRRQQHQGPPIFSSTQWLTSESYRELVEDSGENWLIQFYHDHSEPCKEFAPRWEVRGRERERARARAVCGARGRPAGGGGACGRTGGRRHAAAAAVAGGAPTARARASRPPAPAVSPSRPSPPDAPCRPWRRSCRRWSASRA